MALGFLDIEYEEILKYLAEVEVKKGTCKYLPRARFYIGDTLLSDSKNLVSFGGLVCSDKWAALIQEQPQRVARIVNLTRKCHGLQKRRHSKSNT